MITVSNELFKEALQGLINDFLIPRFIALGMNASGKWINSLVAEVEGNIGYIKGQDYTVYLVAGRPMNQNQSPEAISHFTRWAGHFIFKKWVEDKGLNINPYAVAHKVATKGTRFFPSGTDLLEVLNSKEAKDYLYKKLAAGFTIQVTTEIKKRLWQTLRP